MLRCRILKVIRGVCVRACVCGEGGQGNCVMDMLAL